MRRFRQTLTDCTYPRARLLPIAAFLAVFVYSGSVRAADQKCNRSIEPLDPTINRLALSLDYAAPQANPSHIHKNCTEKEGRQIEAALKKDTELIQQWLSALKSFAPSSEDEFAHVKKPEEYAYGVLQCAQSTIQSKLVFECNAAPPGREAWTLPLIGKTIKLGPAFFDVPELYADGVILHEITHKCGTTDSAYFSKANRPKDTAFASWAMIADTYNYWVQYGFCIPGTNC